MILSHCQPAYYIPPEMPWHRWAGLVNAVWAVRWLGLSLNLQKKYLNHISAMKCLLFLVILVTSRSSKLKENVGPLKLRRPPKALAYLCFLSVLSSSSLRRKSGLWVLGVTRRAALLNKHSGSPFNLLSILHMLGAQVGCTLPAFFFF